MLEELYKKSKDRDIRLIMSRVKYIEKSDKERTNLEEYYDKSVFLMQLRMMKSKFLDFLLKKKNHMWKSGINIRESGMIIII